MSLKTLIELKKLNLAMIELLSIDLSNFCSKECNFCYNHSNMEGNVEWTPDEIIEFASDCIANGVKAISLGGGEPFEYDGVFEIIAKLQKLAYLSLTTNGLPLEDSNVWSQLIQHTPDKIHITIHHPNETQEVKRVKRQIRKLAATSIKPGVNLLVAKDTIEYCRDVYHQLLDDLSPSQIILVPHRYSNTPTPKQIAYVADSKHFQSASCLLGCEPPTNFVSVSWDKKVNRCSYAGGKQPLEALSYQGVINALNKVVFQSCMRFQSSD